MHGRPFTRCTRRRFTPIHTRSLLSIPPLLFILPAFPLRIQADQARIVHSECTSFNRLLLTRLSPNNFSSLSDCRRTEISNSTAIGRNECRSACLREDRRAFVRTALKSNKIGRVGESAPLEGRWMPRGLTEGWGGRRSTVERTGMHRPWGDFCVYRSALTPGAERAWRAAR